MSDLISRSKLFENIKGVEVAWYLDGNYTTYDDTTIMDIIEEQPTVEAVPVVRCKDCKYFCDGYPNVLNADGLCENTDCLVDLYCFCSYGERKDNAVD